MVDIDNFLKSWSDKLSLSVESIRLEFNHLFEDEKTIHTNLTEDQQQDRALKRVALMYKKQLKSPAVGFEGTIIGAGDAVNIVARARKEAQELFRQDPQSAVVQGITNEAGEPLDTRRAWASGQENRNFGKPLPETNYIKNVFGIALKTKDQGEPKFFSMTINGDRALEDIPVFKSVRFMAIDKSEEGSTAFKLNASTFTNFIEDPTLNLPKYETLLKNCCSGSMVELSDLAAYHAQNKDDYNRVVIATGDVSMLNLQPTSMGSRIMILEDMKNIEDLDSNGVTCWIPASCEIDFAEGSKVMVVGRTAQGKKKDEAGNQTEELGDVTINVYGIYPIPEFKIASPETEEISETNLSIS